jgi:hypothetical protein
VISLVFGVQFQYGAMQVNRRMIMAAKRSTKRQKPVRFRAARVDATIGSIARRIDRDYKLPDGSVCLLLPSGRKAHIDGKINNLLSRWG